MPLMLVGLRAAGAEAELDAPLRDERDSDPCGGACVQHVDDLPQNVMGVPTAVEDALDGFERARARR